MQRVTSRDLNITHHIIDGYIVQDNTPQAGYISWSDVHIQYQGVTYNIQDGYTNYKYVWWQKSVSTTQLVAGDTLPTLTDDDVLLFFNKNGIHMTVPKATVIDGGLIVSESIMTPAIAANAITSAKIAAGAITTTHLSADCVTANAIATGAVTADAIAANAIGAAAIASAVITGDKLVADTITSREIASRTITANEIATGTITANEIAASTITGSKIAANTITADKLSVGLRSNNLIPNNYSVTGDRTGWSSGGAVDSTQIFNGKTVTCDKITTSADVMVTSDYIEVDPSITYEISLWHKDDGQTVGTRYFGIYCYDKNKTQINVIPVSKTGTKSAETNNFYYWSGGNGLSWKQYVGYLFAYDTQSGWGVGENVTQNAVMLPNTRYLKIRYLNYFNAGTSTTSYFYNPQVTALPQTIIYGDQIKTGTITADRLAANTITASSGVIANGAITNAMIADASISTAKIIDGSITTAKIGDAQITTAKIADGQITNAKIANAAIDNAKIANVDAGKITTGTLSAARIGAGSITADKIAANTITVDKLASNVGSSLDISSNISISPSSIVQKINTTDGVGKVKTSIGTFNDDGFEVSSSNAQTKTTMNPDGFRVWDISTNEEVANFGSAGTGITRLNVGYVYANNILNCNDVKDNGKTIDLYVNPSNASATDYNNDGRSSSKPFKSLRACLDIIPKLLTMSTTFRVNVFNTINEGTIAISGFMGDGTVILNLDKNCIINGNMYICNNYTRIEIQGNKTNLDTNDGALINNTIGGEATVIFNRCVSFGINGLRINSQGRCNHFYSIRSTGDISLVDAYNAGTSSPRTFLDAGYDSGVTLFNIRGGSTWYYILSRDGSRVSVRDQGYKPNVGASYEEWGGKVFWFGSQTAKDTLVSGAPTATTYTKQWAGTSYVRKRSGYSDTSEFVQGYWSPYPVSTSFCRLNDSDIRTNLSGATNLSGRIYLQRLNTSHGYSSGATVHLWGGSGDVKGTDFGYLGDLAQGEGKWFTLPLGFIQGLQNGSITEVCVYDNSSTDYIKYELNVVVEITYTK